MKFITFRSYISSNFFELIENIIEQCYVYSGVLQENIQNSMWQIFIECWAKKKSHTGSVILTPVKSTIHFLFKNGIVLITLRYTHVLIVFFFFGLNESTISMTTKCDTILLKKKKKKG